MAGSEHERSAQGAGAASRALEAPVPAGLAPAFAWLARHEIPILLALVAFAALVRALRWQVTAVMFNDGPDFLRLALALGRLDFATALAHPFHPLYPLATALVDTLVGRPETAAVVVSVGAGSLAVAALHAMVRSALSPAHGLIAAGLLATQPQAIEYTGDIQSEGLYLFLFLSTAALALSALRRGSAPRAGAAGAVAGLAYLTRPEGLGLVGVAGAVAGLQVLRGQRSWRKGVGLGLALAAGFLLVASPYLGWLRVHEGHWMLSQKKSVSTLVGIDAPGDRSPAASTPPPRPAPAKPAPEPFRFAETLAEVADAHIRALHYGPLLLLALALFLGRAGRARAPYGSFVAIAVSGYFLLLLALAWNVGYVSARHAFVPATLLLGHAAGGALATSARVYQRLSLPSAWLPAALLLLLVAGVGLGKALRPDRVESLAERRAAEWLRVQEIHVRGVAARKQRVAWYAQAPFVDIPPRAHARGLRELGASHLILADDDRHHYPWLEKELRSPALSKLHRAEAAGHAAVVYALPPPP